MVSRHARRAAGAACAAIALLAAVAAGVAIAVKDDTILVSRAIGELGAKGDDVSRQPAISAGGRYVAFESDATTLHPDDTDTVRDVFVRDLEAGTTTLVSRATGAAGAKGSADSTAPAISADGRYVAFASEAKLHLDDGDLNSDVYVRDLQNDTTVLVSRTSAGVKGNDDSSAPAISADGRYIALQSSAKLAPTDDLDFNPDVYRRDLQTGVTVLVSRASGATGTDGNNFSEAPSISGDGQIISFDSIANNLTDDADTTRDVFVRDMSTGVTSLVSRASGATGVKGNSASLRSAVSANGRHVAFDSQANTLDPDDTTAGSLDVYVRDLQTETTTLVSRASGAGGLKGNGGSKEPDISADGRYVAFDSVATNLHPGDTIGTPRGVFVRDLLQAATTLVSRAGGEQGAKGNGDSARAAISDDGRFVAFDSLATNLEPGDTDAVSDVFARDVLGPPDTTPPVITVPPDIAVVATDAGGAAVSYTASSSDNVAVATFGCAPPSGSTFPIGTTTVTCSATDTSANSATTTFTVTVAAPQQQPPPPPPPPPPPGPAPPPPPPPAANGGAAPDKSTAKLSLKRATIQRASRMLDVLAPISGLASGRVLVELRSAGRRLRFKAPIDSANARIRFRKRIPRAQAALGTGILTISYGGDADTRPQAIRLRAAARPAALRLRRPTLAGDRLRASGTTSAAARGTVRLQLEYVHLGETKTRAFSVPIRAGRWRLDAKLAAGTLAEIEARTGTLHSYTLYTGYLPRQIRGEMHSAEVLGSP